MGFADGDQRDRGRIASRAKRRLCDPGPDVFEPGFEIRHYVLIYQIHRPEALSPCGNSHRLLKFRPAISILINSTRADVAELVDAQVSEACSRKGVEVRFFSSAPQNYIPFTFRLFFGPSICSKNKVYHSKPGQHFIARERLLGPRIEVLE